MTDTIKSARLMDQPEDFRKLGICPDHVETWEDSRRNKDTGKGNWEWWYFDSILDGGWKAVVQFFTTAGLRKIMSDGDSPSVTVKITSPDGTYHETSISLHPDACSYGTDRCDVRLGKNTFVGDFREYDIHTEEKDGIAVDLHLKSLGRPYRPGTAYFAFGENEGSDEYFTWLCSVPRGEVTGTITVDGKKHSVHGTGYHDHQWGNRFYIREWNNWVWSRQSFEDCSIMVFDFVAAKDYGFRRIPICFIEDSEGNLIFESTDHVRCSIPGTYTDTEKSDKIYPTGMHYVFHDGEKTVDYTIREHAILEAEGMKRMPFFVKWMLRKEKLDISYSRYAAEGTLRLDDGEKIIRRSGELIYEFMYPGKTFEGHM